MMVATRKRYLLTPRLSERLDNAQLNKRLGRPPWKLVVFAHGRRVERNVSDAKTGLLKVAELNKREGIKAHLVSRYRPFWPPDDDNFFLAKEGMTWCPYCRRWRWFKIPPYKPGAAVGTQEWFNNSLNAQEIECCWWCGITEMDWHVRYINDRWDPRRRRRRKRRNRRRPSS